MPAGGTVIIDKVIKSYHMIINRNALHVDLVVIKLKEFDVILGWIGYLKIML